MKSIEEMLERIKIPNEVQYTQHTSKYDPPEKNTSSTCYARIESGIFIKEKIRSYDKTIWEFYMLWLYDKIFEKVNKKNRHLKIKIKIPTPKGIEWSEEKNLRLNMEFLTGLPIKKYSEKSREYINGKEIKINKKKLNIITSIAFALGVFDRIKTHYLLFHGDIDFRHVMYDPEKLMLGIVDFEKAFIYVPGCGIDRETVEKAITHEREKIIANLSDKFSHLEGFGKILYFFEKGERSPRLKNIKIENYVKKFFEKYNFIPKPPQSVLERIKEAAEKY